MFRIIASAGLLLLILVCSGCDGTEELATEYGKVSGLEGGRSINGVSVFADMFSQRGHRVKKRSRITPRIERYDTVVWFPDDYSPPSDEAITALNRWLNNGYQRTLIYVGRDYNTQADYLADIRQGAPAEQKEELLRREAEAKLVQDMEKDRYEYSWLGEDTDSCQWFQKKQVVRQKATRLSGPMSIGIEEDKTEIELNTILEPNPSTTGTDEDWESDDLLTVNGEPFVYQLTQRRGNYGENKVIIVSNGSFLLNYALVNQENRKLAGKLIGSSSGSDVLFLESTPMGISISDSETNNHNTWSWITHPPLRFIVPHFLFWGVLFCFVFFPIFGRARHIQKKNTSAFRNHIVAMGKLLSRSRLPNRAIERIRKYQQTVSGESHRNQDHR